MENCISVPLSRYRTLGQLCPVLCFHRRGWGWDLSKTLYKVFFFCLDSTSVYPYSTSVLSDKEITNKRLLLQTSRKHENMYTLEEISTTRKEIKTLQF